jgi:hypothetical protein
MSAGASWWVRHISETPKRSVEQPEHPSAVEIRPVIFSN